MADINIFIIESPGEIRKSLKKLLPPQVRASLDQAGVEVDMESHTQMRDKLPAGFPAKFTVPEEVLVFPSEEGESETTRRRRQGMKAMNLKLKRKRIPGNAEV